MKPRLVPNSESSCRSSLSAAFTGMHHHGARLPGGVFSLRRRVCTLGSSGCAQADPGLIVAGGTGERDRQLSGGHLPPAPSAPAGVLHSACQGQWLPYFNPSLCSGVASSRPVWVTE